MYNRAILMGRICNDLEVKTTPSGVTVLSFRIAVDRSYQAKGEERKSDFFNCVAWRQTADFISRFFSKGRMILVEGELQTRQYVDKNNVTQNVVELIVDNARFTGEKKQDGGGSYAPAQGYPEPPPQHPAESTNSAPSASNGSYTAADFAPKGGAADDDYPF
ncbi:MAG: single-stranded DNA-binding protein [Ruminiclostridium sp.]|nr:single-stranded DNA-binding protein [Ruminiclostridium sp.]